LSLEGSTNWGRDESTHIIGLEADSILSGEPRLLTRIYWRPGIDALLNRTAALCQMIIDVPLAIMLAKVVFEHDVGKNGHQEAFAV
jgi:hypothetical protein